MQYQVDVATRSEQQQGASNKGAARGRQDVSAWGRRAIFLRRRLHSMGAAGAGAAWAAGAGAPGQPQRWHLISNQSYTCLMHS